MFKNKNKIDCFINNVINSTHVYFSIKQKILVLPVLIKAVYGEIKFFTQRRYK